MTRVGGDGTTAAELSAGKDRVAAAVTRVGCNSSATADLQAGKDRIAAANLIPTQQIVAAAAGLLNT